MAKLITLQGPNSGRTFSLETERALIGRQPDAVIYLESLAVSRKHALLVCQDGTYFIEDLNSSNGTFLNGQRITGRVPLAERDRLQIGPYTLALRLEPTPPPLDLDPVIRASVSAAPINQTLYAQNPAYKLQVVLEISQQLARTLEVEELLSKLLDQLLLLFPQADRSMVLLCEGDRLVVRAQRGRLQDEAIKYPYSRSLVKRVLEEGLGVLSEDVGHDQELKKTDTLLALNLRSLLCVPLICQDGRRLGVIQLDRSRPGSPFREEDLDVLTALCQLLAVVLDNAELHVEKLREERLLQELALAREIQQGFLPTEFDALRPLGFELYARVHPARQVSGDLYDFFLLDDGRLAFFVGDVSGKGMPAALFMVAVRTLCRHLAAAGDSPAETLRKLNAALAADNPSLMFVTLVHGIYDPRCGEVVLASGGHPQPLMRRAGQAAIVPLKNGRLLGVEVGGDLGLTDLRLTLEPGEMLLLYSDGFTEALAADGKTAFGQERLQEAVADLRTELSLETCAEQVRAAVERFTGTSDLQDDRTLLLLRRGGRTHSRP